MERKLEPLPRTNSVRELWSRTVGGFRKPPYWEERRMSGVFPAETCSAVVVPENDRGEAALRESPREKLLGLRGAGNSILFSDSSRRLSVYDEPRAARPKPGNRSYRFGWQLRAREYEVGNAYRKLRESAAHCFKRVGSALLAVLLSCSDTKAILWHDEGSDNRGSSGVGTPEEKELARHCGAVEVYDIRNAGPYHRFTVSGKLVHNCGYGGGVAALKAFGADKLGMSDEEMAETVDRWREASPHICALWRSLEQAAVRCIRRKKSTLSTVGRVRFDYEEPVLWMVLPSGRRIAYWGADFGLNRWGNQTLSYMGMDQKTKKWSRLETWGGKLTENLVQATARDCLKESMLRLDEAGFDIRGHVHDEVIITAPLTAKVEDACAIMGAEIPWAPGLLLRADGYECQYYRKD